MKPHYTRDTVKHALQCIGLKKGDVVFSHSNVGFLGIPAGGSDLSAVTNTLLEAVFDVIGEEGTFIVPTFTYSFSQGKPFNPDETPSDCGLFSEAVRQSSLSIRSEDPSVSVAAIGSRAKEMTENLPENAYASDAFFDRFYKAEGIICNINFDAGSTFVHYVERLLKVPYRFDKTFTGRFQRGHFEEERKSTIFVPYRKPGTSAKFEVFDRIARAEGAYQTEKVGRGFIGAICSKDVFNIIHRTLSLQPLFLTEGGFVCDESTF